MAALEESMCGCGQRGSLQPHHSPGFAPTEGILLRRVSEAETASPSQEKDLTHHILHRATTRDLQLVLKGIHVSDTQPPEAFSKLCCLGFLEKAVSQFHTAIMFFFFKKKLPTSKSFNSRPALFLSSQNR